MCISLRGQTLTAMLLLNGPGKELVGNDRVIRALGLSKESEDRVLVENTTAEDFLLNKLSKQYCIDNFPQPEGVPF